MDKNSKEFRKMCRDYIELKEQERRISKRIDALNAVLKEAFEVGETYEIEGKLLTKNSVCRQGTDLNKLRAMYPEIAEKCVKDIKYDTLNIADRRIPDEKVRKAG